MSGFFFNILETFFFFGKRLVDGDVKWFNFRPGPAPTEQPPSPTMDSPAMDNSSDPLSPSLSASSSSPLPPPATSAAYANRWGSSNDEEGEEEEEDDDDEEIPFVDDLPIFADAGSKAVHEETKGLEKRRDEAEKVREEE